MKPLPTTNRCEILELSSKKERSPRPKAEDFKKYFAKEDREKKKPSVFDLAAFLFTPIAITPSVEDSATIVPLTKTQCEWIVKEATCAITHTIQNGVKETSLRLEGPAFLDSPFQGIELIVREFTTAPLMFNIEFRGSNLAISSLVPHLQELQALFHDVHRPKEYAIHRIEASLEDTSPFLFHRKPPAEGSSL